MPAEAAWSSKSKLMHSVFWRIASSAANDGHQPVGDDSNNVRNRLEVTHLGKPELGCAVMTD